MIYDVNVIKYTMSWKKILFLTDGMAEWQTRLTLMSNLVREIGFGSCVDQIQHKLSMARHFCDIKLCARGALKRWWSPQTRDTHKGY